MTTTNTKQLHWTQRITLVRHNLHAASRSGDFGFFKSLQAAGLLDGTNHFATLSATLGDDADALLAALDNLNGALSFMHQDAFQNVYDSIKDSMREDGKHADRSKLYVDIGMQRNKAEMAIDKLSHSAIALITQAPAHAQEQAANVYITGLTLVADCVEVVIKQLETLDQKIDDFIRLEDSFNTIKASVLAANTGLKGIFYMLDTYDHQHEDKLPRSLSISSAGTNLFRRMSNAFQSPPSTGSRSSSIASAGASRGSLGGSMPVYRTPNYVRNTVSAGCPTSMPSNVNFEAFNKNSFMSHTLGAIPPTPATESEDMDPFDSVGVPPVPEIAIEQRQMSPAVM